MIKIAELTCGKTICGEIIDDDEADVTWHKLLFIQELIDTNDKKVTRLSPVAAHGDFNQPIIINEADITYMYDPTAKFIKYYRSTVDSIKRMQGDIVVANPADVPKSRFKLV